MPFPEQLCWYVCLGVGVWTAILYRWGNRYLNVLEVKAVKLPSGNNENPHMLENIRNVMDHARYLQERVDENTAKIAEYFEVNGNAIKRDLRADPLHPGKITPKPE